MFEIVQRQVREARTTGWRPTCECGAEPTPAVVLDPLAGTGTTLKVAGQHGRHGIGIELNADYVGLMKARLSQQMQHGTDAAKEAA